MITLDELKALQNKGKLFLQSLNFEQLEAEKTDLQSQLSDPNIWDAPEKAGKLNQKMARVAETLALQDKFQDKIENLSISMELGEIKSAQSLYDEIQKFIDELENETLFTGEFDSEDCFLSVQSGAGGVDAQDWAAMLLSMYQAFCKRQGWDYATVTISLNPEGGVKNALLEIKGKNAFGLLKEEVGVHRLVRLSPFNSGQTRETSFALVEILPASVENGAIEVKIDDKELRWETSTSQGAGGQSVNTTYSAIKLIHIPSGITVSCQNERSQIQNRAQALKVMKSRLYALEVQKRQDLKSEIKGDFKSPEWGSQIRNYVLHPYKLVKDTRSGWETSNPENVIEYGDLMPIIMSVKRGKKV